MTQHLFLGSKGSLETRARRASIAALLIAAFAAVFVVALIPVAAQQGSHIAAVDPASGKVNDSVTATGSALAKSAVSGIFLSDDKSDYKATIVSQEEGKIVFKVPQVKAGNYNVSIQVGASLLIEPVKFNVQE